MNFNNNNEEERSIIANGLMNGSDIIDEYAAETIPSSTSIQQTTAVPSSNSREAASLIYSRMQQHQERERAELEDLSRAELEEELNEADLIASVSASHATRRPIDTSRSIADGLMNHHSSSEDLEQSGIEQQFIQNQQHSHSQEDYGSRDNIGSPEVMGGGAGGALYLPPLPPPPLVPPRRRTIEWADLAAAYWQGVQTGAASSVPRSSSLPTAYDTATSNVAAYDPFSVGPPPLEEVSSSPPHQYSIENLLDLTSPTRGSPPSSSAAYDLEQLLSTGLASQARRETLERSRAQSAVNQALRSIAGGRNSHSSSAMQSSLETRIPPLPSVQSLGERMRPGESLDPNSQRLSYLSSLLGIENGSEDDEDSDYGAEDQMGDEIDEAIRQLEPGRGGSSEELQQAEAAVERLSSLFDGPSSSNSITLRRDLESSDDESMPPLEDIVSNTNTGTSAASSVQATAQLDEGVTKDGNVSPTGKRKSDDDSKQPANKKIKKEENLEGEETKELKANGSPKTCCICLEDPTKEELATINVCDHHFCFTCIDKWSDQENKCPLCKVRFYKIDKVHKPKKRKAGDAEGIGDNNERSSKRVRNRNQRCDHLDFLNAHPLEGMFASMEGGTWPTHIAQLLFSGLGGAPPPSLASGSFNPSRRNMPSSSRHPSSRVAALANARRQHEAAASRVASLRADIAARRQERAERLAERTARMQEWEESRRARAAAREARMASFDRRLADLSAARASLVNRGGSGTSASAIPRSQASSVNRVGVTSNTPYHRSPFAIDTSSPWLSGSASNAMGRSQQGRTTSRHSFPPESSRRRRATSSTAASGAGGRRDDSSILLQPGEEEEEELRRLSTLSPGSFLRRLHREMNGGSSAQYAFNTTRPPRWRRNIHQQSAAGAPPPPPSSASSSSSSFRERMERIQRIRAGAQAALGPPVQEAIEIDSDDDDDDDVVEVIAVE